MYILKFQNILNFYNEKKKTKKLKKVKQVHARITDSFFVVIIK